ncbi:hypothetical protein HK101_010181 [Irineochytrium annulatum]|nr:hypothetical protein HK101_010181 [Irineochytrium annulatum]
MGYVDSYTTVWLPIPRDMSQPGPPPPVPQECQQYVWHQLAMLDWHRQAAQQHHFAGGSYGHRIHSATHRNYNNAYGQPAIPPLHNHNSGYGHPIQPIHVNSQFTKAPNGHGHAHQAGGAYTDNSDHHAANAGGGNSHQTLHRHANAQYRSNHNARQQQHNLSSDRKVGPQQAGSVTRAQAPANKDSVSTTDKQSTINACQERQQVLSAAVVTTASTEPHLDQWWDAGKAVGGPEWGSEVEDDDAATIVGRGSVGSQSAGYGKKKK